MFQILCLPKDLLRIGIFLTKPGIRFTGSVSKVDKFTLLCKRCIKDPGPDLKYFTGFKILIPPLRLLIISC